MKRKGELTKERIIAEAARLIRQKGVEATSINDLITATGLEKGSLYFHFSGKDALTLSALEKARADFLEFLDSSLADTTPGKALDNFFRRVMEVHRSTGFVGGCMFGNAALEMSDKNKTISAFIEQVFDGWRGKVQKVVKAAQASGQVRNDISAGALACLIVATIEGGIMLARLEKKGKPLRDCLSSLRTLIGLRK